MDTRTRNLIAEAIRGAVDELVVDHYPAETQEHQLSSRIGQRLETQAGGLDIFGHRISIITQDIPDKGRGSLEKKSGIDLFISVELKGIDGFSKAILVQSKWDHNVIKKDIQTQCDKMLKLSDHSYVWIYGPNGVKVLDAKKVSSYQGDHINRLRGVNVGTTMRAIIDCKEGDRSLGIEDGPDRRMRLTNRLHDLGARTGVDVEINPTSLDVPQRIPRSDRG